MSDMYKIGSFNCLNLGNTEVPAVGQRTQSTTVWEAQKEWAMMAENTKKKITVSDIIDDMVKDVKIE